MRKAIAHAFDFEEYKRTNYKGLCRQVTGPFPFNSAAYDHTVEPLAYDPDIALDLLEDAGIRADGLAAFFRRLAATGWELPAALRLLSTHPSHDARARLFADAAGQGGAAMSTADWAALRGICKE